MKERIDYDLLELEKDILDDFFSEISSDSDEIPIKEPEQEFSWNELKGVCSRIAEFADKDVPCTTSYAPTKKLVAPMILANKISKQKVIDALIADYQKKDTISHIDPDLPPFNVTEISEPELAKHFPQLVNEAYVKLHSPTSYLYRQMSTKPTNSTVSIQNSDLNVFIEEGVTHMQSQRVINDDSSQIIETQHYTIEAILSELEELSVDSAPDVFKDAVKYLIESKHAELSTFLKKNAHSVLAEDENGYKLLHYAAKLGNSDSMKSIINSGSGLLDKSHSELEALHVSAFVGNKSTLGFLLNNGAMRNSSQVKISLRENITVSTSALHAAILSGEWEAAKQLLDYLKDKPEMGREATKVDKLGNIIHLAIFSNNPWVLRNLLRHETIKNTITATDSGLYNEIGLKEHTKGAGLTPLQLAGYSGNNVGFTVLLNCEHVNICATNKVGRSALHVLAQKGHFRMVMLLLGRFPDSERAWGYMQQPDSSDKLYTAQRLANKQVKAIKEKTSKSLLKTTNKKDQELLGSMMITANILQASNAKALENKYREYDVTPSSSLQTRNLVLQGGGPAGIGLIGALMALQGKLGESDKSLSDIKRVAGTSAGAITGMLFALGLTPEEIENKLNGLDMMSLLDGVSDETLVSYMKNAEALRNNPSLKKGIDFGLSIIKKVYDCHNNASAAWYLYQNRQKIFNDLNSFKGICSGEMLLGWLNNAVNERMCALQKEHPNVITDKDCTNLTLGRLGELTGEGIAGLRHFYAVVLQVSPNQNLLSINSESPEWAHVPIALAVRASASIPFVFEPVELLRIKENSAPEKIICVDGGMLANCPIKLFDKLRYINRFTEGDDNYPIFNHETLALRLVENKPPADNKFDNPVTLKAWLGGVMSSFWEAEQIIAKFEDKFQWRSIVIPKCGVSLLDFNLDDDKKEEILNSGANAVVKKFSEQGELVEIVKPAPEKKSAAQSLGYSSVK